MISNKRSNKTEAKWENVSYLKRTRQVEKIEMKDSTAETRCIDKRKNIENVDVDELGGSKVNLCKKCSESGVSNIVVLKILAKKSFKAHAIIRKDNGR